MLQNFTEWINEDPNRLVGILTLVLICPILGISVVHALDASSNLSEKDMFPTEEESLHFIESERIKELEVEVEQLKEK